MLRFEALTPQITCRQGAVATQAVRLIWWLGIITEHLNDMFCKRLFNLTMSWYRLRYFSLGVLVPVMFATMTKENTVHLFKLFYQIYPLHAMFSSAILRTFGMVSLVSSL